VPPFFSQTCVPLSPNSAPLASYSAPGGRLPGGLFLQPNARPSAAQARGQAGALPSARCCTLRVQRLRADREKRVRHGLRRPQLSSSPRAGCGGLGHGWRGGGALWSGWAARRRGRYLCPAADAYRAPVCLGIGSGLYIREAKCLLMCVRDCGWSANTQTLLARLGSGAVLGLRRATQAVVAQGAAGGEVASRGQGGQRGGMTGTATLGRPV